MWSSLHSWSMSVLHTCYMYPIQLSNQSVLKLIEGFDDKDLVSLKQLMMQGADSWTLLRHEFQMPLQKKNSNESEIKALIQMNSNKPNRESFVYLSIWEIIWQLDIGKGASFWSSIPAAMLKIQIGNRLYYQLPCAMSIHWNTKVSGDLKLFRGVLIKSICSAPGECGTFHCTFSSVLAYVLGAFLDTSSVARQ